MISKDKKYKTRIGLPVKIYEILGDHVIGVILDSEEKCVVATSMWNMEGRIWDINECGNDLIEISPYADFKIDDKVLVWSDSQPKKLKRHFSGLNNKGLPTAFRQGKTSFTSNDDDSMITWDYCIKYEENNDN